MDVDECDFDMQLETEEAWDRAEDQGAFDCPPEAEFPGEPVAPECAPTEIESKSEQESDVPMVSLPIDGGGQPEEEEEPSVRAVSADPSPCGLVREPVARDEVGCRSQDRPAGLDRRVRLFGKQRSPLSVARLSVVGSADHYWGCLDHATFTAMPRRDKYMKVYNKMRWWAQLVGRRAEAAAMAGEDIASNPDLNLIRRANGEIRSMSVADKCKLSKLFATCTSPPRHISDYMQQQWVESVTEDKFVRKYYLQARSCLLTWNGDWGVFGEMVTQGRTWEEVVAVLRLNAQFQQLWTDFTSHCARLADVLSATHHATSMELCVDTLTEQSLVRVHGHGFFNREGAKMQLYHGDAAAFMGIAPHKSFKIAGTGIRPNQANAGFYYLTAPKIGNVMQETTQRPYKDFQVNAEWITNMIQAEKMNFDDALREMVRCGKGFTRRIADLKAWQRAKEELALEDHVKAEAAYHRANNLGWKKFPVIDAWYERNMKPHMRRKEFLVVEGPSGLGKTEYIKALVGVEEVLELNADGMVKPDLHGFSAERHKLIFWDELNVQVIVENRKLFQCPPCFVNLGYSPTGRDMYKVFVNKCVMAIGSNSWSEQVSALPKASDRKWLTKNAVRIEVSEPMWLED